MQLGDNIRFMSGCERYRGRLKADMGNFVLVEVLRPGQQAKLCRVSKRDVVKEDMKKNDITRG